MPANDSWIAATAIAHGLPPGTPTTTDPAQLRDELDARGLRVSGGTVHGLSGLDDGAWKTLVRSTNALGRAVAEEHGVALQFHHHADSHVETPAEVERFLADTDPRHVSLCLDTGHYAYGGGDAADLIRAHPDRIGYVHIKQMDPAVVARARAEDLAFGQAVAIGVSCEPPNGSPDIPSVTRALHERGTETFVIVEQDMYPVDFDVPAPVAERTRRYLVGCGVGT